MVALYPDLSSGTYAHDPLLTYTFVVDCSGSMAGAKMARAKRALALCVRSLPAASWFQVIAFGSDFECAFREGPVEYSDATLASATAFVEGLRASMGTCRS